MALKKIGNLSRSNERIMQSLRPHLSMSFQERIPVFTQSAFRDTLNALDRNPTRWNELESALINLVGLIVGRSMSWSNPLSVFKKGLLEFGETVEEYQVGLVKAYSRNENLDADAKMLFGREFPNVESSFHQVNRDDIYKVTTDRFALKRAFASETGLSEYVNHLLAAPVTSDNYDEFLLMCSLFAAYEERGGFFRVQVPDVSAASSTDDQARGALRVIREVAGNVMFPSTRYNAARMPVAAKPDELVLFTTPAFNAAIDVNALAGAFNMDRLAIQHRTIIIPPEQLGIDKGQAILTTEHFFQVYDTILETSSQENAVSLGTNHFLHHAEIISASRFVPAVLFTSDTVTVVTNPPVPVITVGEISIRDHTNRVIDGDHKAVPGGMYTFEAVITSDQATNEPLPVSYTYSVSGATDVKTRVTRGGVLIIGAKERANQIKVMVTVYYGSQKIDKEITAEIDPAVTDETWPASN